MRIGILGSKVTITEKEGNYYGIGEVLSRKHTVDMVGPHKGHLKELDQIFNFYDYNSIQPNKPGRNSLFIRFLDFIKSIHNMVTYARRKRPDVIISIMADERNSYVIFIAKLLGRCKGIVRFANDPFTIHRSKKNKFNSFLTRLNYKIVLSLCRSFDGIIVLSDSIRQKMIKKGFDSKKVRVIMHPLDYSQYKLNYKPDANLSQKRNVFFGGTLTKRKGLDTILAILKNKDIQEKCHFYLAGKDKGGYAKYITKYPNVSYLGQIPKKKVIEYLHTVDAVMVPSISDPFPKIITDAYMCGAPIIVRDIPELDRLYDYRFSDEKELIDILLNKKMIRKKKIDIPQDFKRDIIDKQYLDLIDYVVRKK